MRPAAEKERMMVQATKCGARNSMHSTPVLSSIALPSQTIKGPKNLIICINVLIPVVNISSKSFPVTLIRCL